MNLKRKKILLLGGSRQQVVAIEKAKELGCRTVLCDYLPDNPGRCVADVYYDASTLDKERILEIARMEDIDGILAYASDPAASTAAYVATILGLPTNALKAVETMSNKALFRDHLERNGFACPKAIVIDADYDIGDPRDVLKHFSGPIVVKPTDSSGSKGVSVVDKHEGILDAIQKANRASRIGQVIAEEYIEREYPFVIGGDVFVCEGVITFWGLMDCIREPRSSLVPAGEMLRPALSSEQYALIQETLQRLITSLGVTFGEFNVEIMLSKGNVPYVMELGARAGGNMIPLELSDASGEDLIAANIKCALGEDPGVSSWCTLHSERTLATYVLHAERKGKYEGFLLPESIKGYLYRAIDYKDVGMEVDKFYGANQALGVLFFEFPDVDFMHRHLVNASEKIMVRIAKG